MSLTRYGDLNMLLEEVKTSMEIINNFSSVGYPIGVVSDSQADNNDIVVAASAKLTDGSFSILIPCRTMKKYSEYPKLLTFIIYHEIGHLVCGHNSNRQLNNTSISESEADQYAMNRCPLTIAEINVLFDISDKMFNQSIGENKRRYEILKMAETA